MFQKDAHPLRPSDALGNYKFFNAELVAPTFDHNEICQYFIDSHPAARVKLDTHYNWNKDGNIIISGLFDWLFNNKMQSPEKSKKGRTYYNMIKSEFAMYRWYLRMKKGEANWD